VRPMSWNEPPADAPVPADHARADGPPPAAVPAVPEPAEAEPSADTTIDRLAAVAADLDRVEAALARLDDGTYGTCVVTGEALPDELLAADPTTDRLPAAG